MPLTPASLILILTVGVSFLCFQNEALKDKLILHPWRDSREGRWYTLISSGFIHADWTHLGMNAFSYYFFAFHLEDLIGPLYFTVLYLGSLVLSDFPTWIKYKDDSRYRSLGASGAVSAVIFSYIVLTLPTHQDMSIYVFFIPLPAWAFGLLYLGYSFYMSRREDSQVNHSAHFFGALSGILFSFLFYPSLGKQWLNALGG
jgi:membrane associated rhomboid family serine protease